MDLIRSFSGRALLRILLIGFLVLCLSIAFSAFCTAVAIRALMPHLTGGAMMITKIAGQPLVLTPVTAYGAGVFVAVMLLMGLLLWGLVRGAAKSVFSGAAASPKPQKKVDTSEEEKRRARVRDQRLYLHLISLLQRDGRLLDFLATDLGPFEDAQIGAAVRNIHENCKKALDKSLAIQAVIDQEEGDTVTVGPDFDPSSVKLSGNVTGDPPFEGVLRHKGWKVKKVEMPTLSGDADPDTLCPAEVEIS